MCYGRRLHVPRAPGRSPCSPASKGAGGRSWGDRSSPETTSRRRPEFGCARDRVVVHGEDGGGVICATGSVMSTMESSDMSSSD